MTRPLFLLALAACGRSEGEPDTRIAAVASETSTFVAGHDGARVSVVVVNDGVQTWQVERAALTYRGAGNLQSTSLRQRLPLLPPRSTATVPFLVHLPGNGEGAAEIDAEVRLADYEHSDARVLRGAETPLRFTYEASPPAPDISSLPVLVVTTTDDELDGGDALTDVGAAGGAADLSLREALTIVNNQGTPYRITFDPAVFPLPTGASILVDTLGPPPTVHVAGTAIDGTGAGVTLGVDPANDDGWLTWSIAAERVVLQQLTVSITGYNGGGVSLGNCHDCTLVDFTYTEYDGLVSIHASQRLHARRLHVLSGGVSIDSSDDVLIEDSDCSRRVEINDSTATVFRNSTGHDWFRFDVFNSPDTWLVGLTFDDVDEPQVDVSGDCSGTTIADNTFIDSGVWNGARPLLRVATSQRVTMSHNLMVRPNAETLIELVPGANADRAAPVLTTVTTNSVAGTTDAADGSVVEVYADPSGGLERWLGDTMASGGSFSLSGLTLSADDQIRAIVTDPDGNTSPASTPESIP